MIQKIVSGGQTGANQAALDAAIKINNWIYAYKIEILNIAGSRASEDPMIYQAVYETMETLFNLNIVSFEIPNHSCGNADIPCTVTEAVLKR